MLSGLDLYLISLPILYMFFFFCSLVTLKGGFYHVPIHFSSFAKIAAYRPDLPLVQ